MTHTNISPQSNLVYASSATIPTSTAHLYEVVDPRDASLLYEVVDLLKCFHRRANPNVEYVRAILQKCFSAPVFGAIGIVVGLICLALSIAFFTVWSPIVEADRLKIGQGLFNPLTTKIALAYCGLVLLGCAAVTMNLRESRQRLAAWLGSQWKLTSALAGTVLASSVVYILLTFIATRIVYISPHPERPQALYYASFFGYELLVPTIRFTREDAFTAFFMLMSGMVAFGMFLFLSLNDYKAFRSKLPGELWGMMSFGFSFLAADELFELHRFLGRNLPFLKEVNIHSEPGYAIFVVYVLLALAVLYAYRSDLLRNKFASRALFAGIGFQILAVALDAYGKFWRREEALEIAGAALWLVAVVYYAYDEIVSYVKFRLENT